MLLQRIQVESDRSGKERLDAAVIVSNRRVKEDQDELTGSRGTIDTRDRSSCKEIAEMSKPSILCKAEFY